MADNRARSFTWTPGQGPDPEALKRMAVVFAKPKAPMGEAWFMGEERQLYPELQGDLGELSDDQLTQPLGELANGVPSFGPLREWTDWYHYLLPRLLQREWELKLPWHPVEPLLTGFFSQHPNPAEGSPYAAFRDDALATLGQYIMSTEFWSVDDDEVPRFFTKWEGPSGLMLWDKVDGLLSGSLFLCIKYLPAELAGPWFRSVLAIPNRYWRAQVAIWLVGAYSILTNEITQPAQFSDDLHFDIGWDWSHKLSGNYSGVHQRSTEFPPFLPSQAREAILQVARGIEPEWLLDIYTDPRLARIMAEVPDLPDQFEQLYRQ